MESTKQEDRQKVWDLIKEVKVAMLVTQDAQHNLSARPMVGQQDTFDGTLWFFTWANSPKTAELQTSNKVLLAYSHPAKQDYVSVQGHARVVRDQAKVKELWSEPMRTWFPKGSDDPNIALIAVDVDTAEYWDAPSSTMVHAYGYVKAVVTGEPPHPGDNKKVSF